MPFCIVVALAVSLAAQSSEQDNITIRVTAEDGPVAGARVSVAGQSERTNARGVVVLSTVSALFTTAAAVLAVILIQRIDELQTNRPWVPWWAIGESQPGFQPPAR